MSLLSLYSNLIAPFFSQSSQIVNPWYSSLSVSANVRGKKIKFKLNTKHKLYSLHILNCTYRIFSFLKWLNSSRGALRLDDIFLTNNDFSFGIDVISCKCFTKILIFFFDSGTHWLVGE